MFIIFVDLWVTITYFCILVSVIYSNTDYTTEIEAVFREDSIVPIYVLLLLGMFIMKNVLGILYILCFSRKKDEFGNGGYGTNRSFQTTKLFLVRLIYDLIATAIIVLIQEKPMIGN